MTLEKDLAQCEGLSYMFVQAPCIIPKELYTRRLVFGLFGSCLAVFIYMNAQVYFDYLTAAQKSMYVDYDVKTITAADYSIEFDITPE